MTGFFEGEFITISIPVLARIQGDAPFDIYIRRAENAFTKLFPAGDSIDRDRLEAYRSKKGIESLSVKREDYQAYLIYAERVASSCLAQPSTLSGEELTEIVQEMANLAMVEIFSKVQVDERSISHATNTIRGCIETLGRDPISLVKLVRQMRTHPYLMKHGIATSVFSLLLAKREGLESSKSLFSIGMGALLHDLGLAQLTFSAEDSPDIDPEQRKELRRHPELGKRMLDSVKSVGTEVRMIVLQHHEQPNGGGYPNGLRDLEIYYPAKIVAICDSFSALISERPHRQGFQPPEALEIMREDLGKFDRKLFASFATMLFPGQA